MKITCDKQKLNEAVLNIQRAVSSKSSIPALEGILIQAKDNTVQLCGYDLELGITTYFDCNTEENGSIVLSARLLSEIVRRLPAATVTIMTDEKQMTTIQSGETEYSIVGIPAQEYPELPAVGGENTLKVQSGILRSMIRQTLFAVAENDAKPIHTGTLFELETDCLRLVSVDGYRLAIREEPIKCESKTNFVVPGKTLGEVLKLLGDDDNEVELQIGRRHILFSIQNYTVISRLLEGEFLDYRAAVPNECSTELKVSTQSFISSVERVSLLITDRLKSPVRCIFEENEIRVSCSTAIGRANDKLDAQITGSSLEMGFNNRFLLDALRNTECDEVRVQLNGPLSPMRILPREGNAFLFLVLPVRLKNTGE
ncbi:DNA polymerase III subunit beta [Caproiciproducens sp. NJN-50]|uniref:DNA polymerase III subunit beta n=1 Tax=Acutalibacteraceae TaxID=3082771 RepID=UPI000FFE13CF|nr:MULTISPECIES: DNA polymerase III subunit beta [Acutalibacteraceae]QAT48285.1 DNA polymerase III subunit beta [Caproiciproducens sp. NJN-50]